MDALDAIVLRLESQNVGVGGTTIFEGSDVNLPDGPGPFLSVLQTAGKPPIGVHNSSALRQPAFQITSRGEIYADAVTLLEQALIALGGTKNLTNILIGTVFFLYIRPSSDKFDLPPDAQGRVRIAFNVNSLRR